MLKLLNKNLRHFQLKLKHDQINLLKEIIIIFTLSITVIFIFHKFKLPSIIGFLFTGLITGPHGLQLIANSHDVELLAEIGIILLLFTIGIEFSIKNLIKAKRSIIIGGAMQVGFVIVVVYLISQLTGASPGESVFLGFLASLSSTAIVMKIIQGRGELGTFHGNTSLAILIFQDIIIIPMILVTPVLAGEAVDGGSSFLLVLLKISIVVSLMILGAKFFVPKILYQIAKTQNRELFLLTIIVIGFATAWLTSVTGLSLALGAFIAGLVISESDYSEQAFGNIIPFRDLFTSFFFVSVGMLLDMKFVFENLTLVLIISIGLVILKATVTGFVAFLLGYPLKTTIIVGFSLSQIGEFSFVLSDFGIKYELLSPFNYQLFLSVAVISLSATPFIINMSPKVGEWILKWNIPYKIRYGLRNLKENIEEKASEHVIIIGYGLNGRNVARAAQFANIPHVIIELNPDTVKSEFSKGKLIQYGDATQESILKHAGIDEAKILVVTIPNPADIRLITQKAKTLNPLIHVIIRTRFILDVPHLFELGADEVVPEEFETSIEIFTRVLIKYQVPMNDIEDLVSAVRDDAYQMFRNPIIEDAGQKRISMFRPNSELHTIKVTEKFDLVGKSFAECNFPDHQITILAVVRNGEIIAKPDHLFIVQKFDIIFFLGEIQNLREVIDGFHCEKK